MSVAAALGFLMTLCITVNQVPQIVHTLRTRDVAGVSPAAYVIALVGDLAGVGYGVLIGQLPVVLTSATCALCAATMLVLVLMPGRAAPVRRGARPGAGGPVCRCLACRFDRARARGA